MKMLPEFILCHTSFMFNFSVKIHAENLPLQLILLAQNRLCDSIPATLKQKTLHSLDE